MTKVLRRAMVEELSRDFAGSANLVLINPEGLTASEAVELRSQLREGEIRMRLVKNSVARHTFRKLGVEAFEDHLEGMSALVYGPDPLEIAKKLAAYRDKHQRPKVKYAVIEGQVMGPEEIAALSRLPGREQILGMFFATLNAPVQKFAATLNEIPRSFAGVLDAVAKREDGDKKE